MLHLKKCNVTLTFLYVCVKTGIKFKCAHISLSTYADRYKTLQFNKMFTFPVEANVEYQLLGVHILHLTHFYFI